ncbi:hypothetical protein MF271_22295 (plasmid) [Deinococcus sp. KNUC1210]|uniref:hypothetical protein n=1 Tax=Deinococcus sp. KNUC1210 TaxID=2917691 RepID=UPI001EF00BBE|nr:hypothetical protein [Deinococcus sp. KNUC1210]ULH18203.1 hypothetical protein MF271_22295 [Deinococcus sp. KNUC1210]
MNPMSSRSKARLLSIPVWHQRYLEVEATLERAQADLSVILQAAALQIATPVHLHVLNTARIAAAEYLQAS